MAYCEVSVPRIRGDDPVADGAGFEPAEPCGLTRLATWRDKPLCHPSMFSLLFAQTGHNAIEPKKVRVSNRDNVSALFVL